MNAVRIAGGCLIGFGAVAALWLMGRVENPVRDARVEGWRTSREILWSRASPATASDVVADPVVQFAGSLEDAPAGVTSIQRTVYVPAYSHLRVGSGQRRLALSATLSIHNSSREEAIVLKRIAYHNTEGELVESFLGRPVALRPLATVEVFIAADDERGGSGASFVVDWASAAPVSEPVIEAVMIGTIGAASYSFVSQGRDMKLVAAE